MQYLKLTIERSRRSFWIPVYRGFSPQQGGSKAEWHGRREIALGRVDSEIKDGEGKGLDPSRSGPQVASPPM